MSRSLVFSEPKSVSKVQRAIHELDINWSYKLNRLIKLLNALIVLIKAIMISVTVTHWETVNTTYMYAWDHAIHTRSWYP